MIQDQLFLVYARAANGTIGKDGGLPWHIPADLKQFSDAELVQVAHELRQETISAVSETGGHLGAGLG